MNAYEDLWRNPGDLLPERQVMLQEPDVFRRGAGQDDSEGHQ